MDDPGTLEARVKAGEWLTIGEIAVLLGLGRTSVHRLVANGEIRHRLKPGPGKYRTGNPVDVLRLLGEARQEHGGETVVPGE